jgi:hypothetical protein
MTDTGRRLVTEGITVTDPDLTVVALLVDRSGSMQSVKSDAEGAIAAFIEAQRAVPGRCLVRLSDFDTEYREVYPMTPIADVPAYTLEPRGGTALLDGIGRLVTGLGADLAALPEEKRPGKVIVVVQTDGQENSSREWNSKGINALITQQREQFSWDFVFLGAGPDAIQTAESYGFAAGSAIAYTASGAGTKSVVAAAANYVARARSGSAPAAFTDEERNSTL